MTTKKSAQSSGSSYSLIALLKRTLFLHETATAEELVEEVHEYMLKDRPSDEIRTRYVEPVLHSNPSFVEVKQGNNCWRLTEGNKVNDSIYEIFRKQKAPLSDRQILNRLAKVANVEKIDIALDLKNDARFSDIENGKYWILSEWIVINEYARTMLLRLKGGLTEKELITKVAEEHKIDQTTAVFLPMLDDRFVKQEGRWTLKKFVEQKTKLRASRIDRLFQYLRTTGGPLTADDLTSTVLNMPAIATDVEDKLMADPRFVRVNDKWMLREQLEKPPAVVIKPEIAPEAAVAAAPEVEAQAPELREEAVVPAEEMQARPPTLERLTPEVVELQEAGAAEPAAAAPVVVEAVPIPETHVQEAKVELAEEDLFRKKVVEFLQDAFMAERIVYSADIINQLVTSPEKAEIFEQFSLEHFANPAKHRELTDADIIKFMVYLAESTLNDKILDPCCGTGGFLVQVLDNHRAQLSDATWIEKEATIQYDLRNGQFYFAQLTEDERKTFAFPLDDALVRRLPIVRCCKQQLLTGVDVDPYAYKTAVLNIAVNGFPDIVLHQDNALTSKQIGSGVYDIVIGNPPAHEDLPTRFLRRSLVLAKPGGKILLLLPETMFSESRLVSASLRHQLAAQAIIRAIIDFPEPYNEKAYGPRRVLLYGIKKHLEAEQQSNIFIGQVPDLDGLREIIEVLEDATIPPCDSDEPIDPELVLYVLSLYQGTAYNLMLEGLRRRTLEGKLMTVDEWVQAKKSDQAEQEDEEDAEKE